MHNRVFWLFGLTTNSLYARRRTLSSVRMTINFACTAPFTMQPSRQIFCNEIQWIMTVFLNELKVKSSYCSCWSTLVFTPICCLMNNMNALCTLHFGWPHQPESLTLHSVRVYNRQRSSHTHTQQNAQRKGRESKAVILLMWPSGKHNLFRTCR